MELLIITGVSGAGKTTAISALEDIGFYCIDNMPPFLMDSFVQLCAVTGDKEKRLSRVAIVTDVRGGTMFLELRNALDGLRSEKTSFKLLFLDADDDEIVRRYKETRRKHPLADKTQTNGGSLLAEAVKEERHMLIPIRALADYIVDTTHISSAQLKERLTMLFLGEATQALSVHCMSFGFKYGSASEADLVFDVRCLPNPFYIEELRPHTGLDQPVRDYVFSFEQSTVFVDKLLDMIDFLLPLYLSEGKSHLVIAIGCTGGKHRSVAIAERLCKHIISHKYRATINHRDISKGHG